MSDEGKSQRIFERIAAGLDDDTFIKLFSPDGLARQTLWHCEDGWMVGYTTERIRGGRLAGKFAVFAHKPVGRGARSGDPSEWIKVYQRAFSTRRAAKARAVELYYRHSPKRAAAHGRTS